MFHNKFILSLSFLFLIFLGNTLLGASNKRKTSSEDEDPKNDTILEVFLLLDNTSASQSFSPSSSTASPAASSTASPADSSDQAIKKRRKKKHPYQTREKQFNSPSGKNREKGNLFRMLGENGEIILYPYGSDKKLPAGVRKQAQPVRGFYHNYENVYDSFLDKFPNESYISVGMGHNFHNRTLAFAIVANFLKNSDQLYSDYAYDDIKEILYNDPHYKDSKAIIEDEGRLYITENRYEEFSTYVVREKTYNLFLNVFEAFKNEAKRMSFLGEDRQADELYFFLEKYKNSSSFLEAFKKNAVRSTVEADLSLATQSEENINFSNGDHIIPKSRNGANSLQNLAIISARLNRKKSDHTPGKIRSAEYQATGDTSKNQRKKSLSLKTRKNLFPKSLESFETNPDLEKTPVLIPQNQNAQAAPAVTIVKTAVIAVATMGY